MPVLDRPSSRVAAPTVSVAASETCPVPAASPARTLLLLGGALAAGIVVVAGLSAGSASPLTGYLRTETAALAPDRDARIAELVIAEGASVEPGTQVAWLIDDAAEENIRKQHEEIAALEAELSRLQAKANLDIQWRLKAIETDILQTRLKSAEYLKHQFQYELEELAWKEFGRLGAGTSSPDSDGFQPVGFEERLSENDRLRSLLQQDVSRNKAEVVRAQAELCEQRLVELESLRAKLPEEIRLASGVNQAESHLRTARAKLVHLESREKRFPLLSTAYGTIGSFRVQVGEAVRSGETLVEVLDGQRSHVLVRIPSRQAPDFRPGAEVSLEFPGGEERSGRVAEVDPQAVAPHDAGLLFGGDDALVAVRIEQIDKSWPEVAVGSAVNVTARPE